MVVKMMMKHCQIFCKFIVKDRDQHFSVEECEKIIAAVSRRIF
jgi:hypothetical protein